MTVVLSSAMIAPVKTTQRRDIRIMTFKTVGLIGRHRNIQIKPTLEGLWCDLNAAGIGVVVEQQTAELLDNVKVMSVPRDQLSVHCDLLITIGGDGSLMQAAHAAVEQDLPVLGVNRGRLGFLTDVHPDEVTAKVQEVLAGEYSEEERFLMAVTTAGETPQYRSMALNDTVILPGLSPHMIEFAVYVNDEFVCQQRADGVIIATPTGSTAYSLSGGGPILHPQLDAVVIVPMFPHTLSSRPLVVKGSSDISVNIVASNEFSPQLSCDGQGRVSVAPGGQVKISKYHKPLKLIHPKSYNYYEALRSKLGWGGQH